MGREAHVVAVCLALVPMVVACARPPLDAHGPTMHTMFDGGGLPEVGKSGGTAGASGDRGDAGGTAEDGPTPVEDARDGGRACTQVDCAPQPREQACIDDGRPAFACARDADGVCRWHPSSCTPRCTDLGGANECGKVVGCFFVILGCNDPRGAGNFCVREDQVFLSGGCTRQNCPGGGESPTQCRRFVADSCTLATGRFNSSCFDDVCRDRSIDICMDRSF